jgi:hypothetical protein
VSDLLDPKDVERVVMAILEAIATEDPYGWELRPGCFEFGIPYPTAIAEMAARAAIRAMQPAPLPVVTPSAGWADGEKFAKE